MTAYCLRWQYCEALINNIPIWAKWIVFVIELNLLLSCFGVSPLYTFHNWFNSKRRRVAPSPLPSLSTVGKLFILLVGERVRWWRTKETCSSNKQKKKIVNFQKNAKYTKELMKKKPRRHCWRSLYDVICSMKCDILYSFWIQSCAT